MEPTTKLNEAVDNPRSRRAYFAGVVGGLGAWLVSAAQRAMPAEAAAGEPVLAGRSNSGGRSTAELTANTPAISLREGGMPVFRAVNAGGGDGLRGVVTTGRGVVGIAKEPGGIGVLGRAKDGRGVWAISSGEGTAVYASGFGPRSTALVAEASQPSRVAFRTHGQTIFDGLVQVRNLFLEGTGHGAPPPGGAKLLVKSNASGKTQLCVRFNTGVVQVIATEP